MKTIINYNNRNHTIDLSKPLDLSIPITGNSNNVIAWYLDPPIIKPFEKDGWIASVDKGAAINFNNIQFNPHGHGTHTETVGHIIEETHYINDHLDRFFFFAEVITVAPEKINEDWIISKKQIQFALGGKKRDAIIIRTLPNTRDKFSRNYSHTNPTYLSEEAAIFLKNKGILHLLTDLPSIDKEKDNGELLAHHAFWDTKGKIRKNATITELIYVSNKIKDGTYFLNLMIAPFNNDASPSKPVLYRIE